MNKKDKEFIDEVWKKVNYLEYVRVKDEREIQCKKVDKKRKIQLVLIFCSVLCILLIPVLITKKLDMIYVYVLGICILGFSCYYENYLKEISQ